MDDKDDGLRSEVDDEEVIAASRKRLEIDDDIQPQSVTTRSASPKKQMRDYPRDPNGGYLDVNKSFPKDRPSRMVNTGTQKDRITTSGSYIEEQRQPPPSFSKTVPTIPPREGQDDITYLDVSRFSKDRPSTLVNTGTNKPGTTSGSYYDEDRTNVA